MGVAGGSIKDALMQDMAGGAGFQLSTVGRPPERNLTFQDFEY